MYLLIVTGMSGAGKSQVLNKLEDMGFFCVDNLPVALIVDFARLCTSKEDLVSRAAVGIDSREGMSFDQIYSRIDELKAMGVKTEILFVDAPDDVLIRRYKETRRTHPLSRTGWVQEGIDREREVMGELKAMADHTINTGNLKPAELGLQIEHLFEMSEEFTLLVMSFGFKHGIPADADFVFDLRFLPNPFWVEGLRPLSGRDEPVAQYVMQQAEAEKFLAAVQDLITALLPAFEREGKRQVVVAFGCTGGRHRSVCLAEAFARAMGEQPRVRLLHRDIKNEAK